MSARRASNLPPDAPARPRRLFVVTALLAVAGCAGMEPYDPPDYRAHPPGRGMFSGDAGEFVIHSRRSETPPAESETGDSGEEESNRTR